MELAHPQRRLSVREYFPLAEASPNKLEFKAGELIDMAGASFNHNRIAMNIGGELRSLLRSRSCQTTGSGARVKVADDRYCYPDVSVVCGDVAFDPLDPGVTLTNPSLIFEVLSPTTEAMDRGEKFFRYIRLPSLQEYFLVAQNQPRVESFFRQRDGVWSVGPVAEGMQSSVQITSLDVQLPLAEIYSNVRFDSQLGSG